MLSGTMPSGTIPSNTKIRPFLMFEGKAEEAMNFYVSLFPDARISDLVRYGPGESGVEGSVVKAVFTVAGQTLLCSDSAVHHDFTFTPSISFFVTCESEEEIRRLAAALSEAGKTFMPLGHYGFSRQFAWVSDRYGVSWQLTLD
jgi:predicted 3-demethylubiquinone-9 3-methyltransferase (glyoxalase superfamily)